MEIGESGGGESQEMKSDNCKLEIKDPCSSRTRLNSLKKYTNSSMDMEQGSPAVAISNMWKAFEVHESSTRTSESDSMDMEVDPFDQMYIICDTNIWIGDSDLIKRLLGSKFGRFAAPHIVIPYVVLQELDVRDHQKKDSSSRGAKKGSNGTRNAIKYIYELLRSKSPQIKTQKASEAALAEWKSDEVNADDSILNCVQQFITPSVTDIVILISNDKNLLCKAMANGLKAFEGSEAIKRIEEEFCAVKSDPGQVKSSDLPAKSSPPPPQGRKIIEPTKSYGKSDRPRRIPSSSIPSESKSTSSGTTNRKRSLQIDEDDPMDAVAPSKVIHFTPRTASSFPEVKNLVKDTLAFVIESKMREDFGEELWLQMLKIKPPFTLKTALIAILKHWLAVFSFVFLPRSEQIVQDLLESVKQLDKSSSGGNPKELEENFIENTIDLFNKVGSKQEKLHERDYYRAIMETRQSLLAYQLNNPRGNLKT